MVGNALRQKLLLCAVGAGVFASSASGIVIRHDRDQSAHLGAAADAMFEPVGKLTRNGILRGGGVLVSNRFVLTAAGNVFNTTPQEFEWEFNINGVEYDVKTIKIHPKYYDDPVQGADLALLELDVPEDFDPGFEPASVYGGSDEFGREGILAAPGTSGFGNGGGLFQDGQFRVGTNIIDDVFDDGEIAWLKTDFDSPDSPVPNPLGSSTPTDLEFGMAAADYGAPLFIEVGGEKFVAGVASWFTPNSLYGSENYYTRVSHYADFFRDCNIPIEVPAPAVLSTLAFGLLMPRRRR